MSFWGGLFGSDKAIDAGINTLDAIVFTDEEKASAKREFLRLYEPYKKGQRVLAMIYCPIYALAWFLTFLTELLAANFGNEVNLANVYKLLGGEMSTMGILILMFYFGGGAAEGIVSRFKAKSK